MTQKNADDIARDALSKIGVAQAGQDISAEDLELAKQRLGDVVDDLNGRGVCYVPDTGSVDGALGTHLATMTAIALRADFADDGAFLPAAYEVENAIRLLQAQRPTYAPQRAVYF